MTVDYPTLVKFGTSRRAALTAAAAETLMLPFLLSAALVLLTLLTEVIMQTNMPLGLILMALIMLNLLCHTFGLDRGSADIPVRAVWNDRGLVYVHILFHAAAGSVF